MTYTFHLEKSSIVFRVSKKSTKQDPKKMSNSTFDVTLLGVVSPRSKLETAHVFIKGEVAGI